MELCGWHVLPDRLRKLAADNGMTHKLGAGIATPFRFLSGFGIWTVHRRKTVGVQFAGSNIVEWILIAAAIGHAASLGYRRLHTILVR